MATVASRPGMTENPIAPRVPTRAPARVVGEGATAEAGQAGEPVADTFDEPQGRSRRPKGRGEETGEQRSGDFVADVGEEAGAPDPGHSRPEPRPTHLSSAPHPS